MNHHISSQKQRLVYTVIFGNYDNLKEVRVKNPKIDYICITDNRKLKSDTWDIQLVQGGGDSILLNRQYKMLPHKYFPHCQTLYIDGNIEILSDVEELFDKYLSVIHPLALPKHPFRQCIYDESYHCLTSGKVSEDELHSLMLLYHSSNFPYNYGLSENNLIFRQNQDDINFIMDEWFSLFCKYAKRDQLTLHYLLWKSDISFLSVLEGPRYSNKYWKLNYHIKEQKLSLFRKVFLYSSLNQKRCKLYLILDKLKELYKALKSK